MFFCSLDAQQISYSCPLTRGHCAVFHELVLVDGLHKISPVYDWCAKNQISAEFEAIRDRLIMQITHQYHRCRTFVASFNSPRLFSNDIAQQILMKRQSTWTRYGEPQPYAPQKPGYCSPCGYARCGPSILCTRCLLLSHTRADAEEMAGQAITRFIEEGDNFFRPQFACHGGWGLNEREGSACARCKERGGGGGRRSSVQGLMCRAVPLAGLRFALSQRWLVRIQFKNYSFQKKILLWIYIKKYF